MAKDLYRRLPSVDRLCRLQSDASPALARAAAQALVAALREGLDDDRDRDATLALLDDDAALTDRLAEERVRLEARAHRRVLNATGILLHTGLGRAPLCAAARAAVAAAGGATVVEVDPASGRRNRREDAVAALLTELCGAEAATVVNNNAAATMLALDALARGRSVPVSRGELVEIGGGFRMPDVMDQAGCRLVEVGTTNRTRLADYEAAIDEDTGCLLKVHPSNYRIEGFAQGVDLADLVTLGREHGLPVYEDLGSGYLLDEPLPHDPRERSVQETLRAGVDLVSFSGDKLLGSVQAGIIVGRRALVERCAKHPLYRALRLDKLALAALEATLLVYRFGDPRREIPVLRAIFTDAAELEPRGQALLAATSAPLAALGVVAALRPAAAYVGGATPARALPSLALALRPATDGPTLEALARRLRLAEPGLWGRIEDERLLLDLRSLPPEEDSDLIQVLAGPAG
ncbi:MAG: L-seryl-tRNA(Sec) selenium transferase [Planctomycetota bacterium]